MAFNCSAVTCFCWRVFWYVSSYWPHMGIILNDFTCWFVNVAHYSPIRVQENSAMQRFVRSWPRSRLKHQSHLLLLLQPANPCRSSRSTGLRSHGTTSEKTQNMRNLEISGLPGNHYAPLERRLARLELEKQGWRFGSIREAWITAKGFPHSGEPGAVARNRTFLQVHQSDEKKKNISEWKSIIYVYIYYM